MISVPNRILVALEPVDFRKQIDGLASVCESQLGEEPLDGTLFLFRNRRRTALKGLMWTSGGFTMVYKKLERGQFQWPTGTDGKAFVTRAELAALLEGLDVTNAPRLSRWNPRNQRDKASPSG